MSTRRWTQRLSGLAALALALGALLAPGVGEACSKCLAASSEETKLAYVLTTVFMSVLPLAGIGGLVWWLVRRARAAEALLRGGVAAEPLPVRERATLQG